MHAYPVPLASPSSPAGAWPAFAQPTAAPTAVQGGPAPVHPAGEVDARLAVRLAGLDVLVLPGWNDSGAAHWQSRWETRYPRWRRVQQRDWANPSREDWIATLGAAIDACTRPVLLVAHSLGCVTAAHWAARHGAGRVAAALLVAPADVERRTVAGPLRDFAPLPRAALPFPALVVASDDDPACSAPRAATLARDWGAGLVVLPRHGHINADSGLGDWLPGRELLDAWLAQGGLRP